MYKLKRFFFNIFEPILCKKDKKKTELLFVISEDNLMS